MRKPVAHSTFNYEKFAARFDRRFISDSMIQDLWNSKSAQHGGKYDLSDFHKIGPKGKRVLDLFLRLFIDINTEGSCYFERTIEEKKFKTLSQRLGSHHHLGRDITIEHTLGIPRVSYSSEYHNCANGRYGLSANPVVAITPKKKSRSLNYENHTTSKWGHCPRCLFRKN